MRKKRKSRLPAPKPGEPRKCKGCPDLYIPGVGGAFKDHCARCQKRLSRKQPLGPRARLPPGQRKPRVKATLHEDMAKALDAKTLKAAKVKNAGDYLVQSGARRLGRPEWEPVSLKKKVELKDGEVETHLKVSVHPDMVAALDAEKLAAFGVTTIGEFLVQSAARRLGRPAWEPTPSKIRRAS